MTTVLHLAHVSVPQDARILRELNALSSLPDLELHAYSVRDDEIPDRPIPARLRQFRLHSARTSRLPRAARYALVLLELNARFIARMLKLRPDVVHCHDTMVLPAGAMAKILMGSKVVYDAHELESDKAGQSKTLSKATLLIENVCWSRIDRLITVSPSITTWYADNLGSKPTTCILNSPETRRPASEATFRGPGLRGRLGLGTDTPLFVYVGGLEPGRGIELILKSFAGSDNEAHVAFIGWGSLEEEIKRQSEVQGNIHYCPRVPHDELVSFIQEATGGLCLIEDVSLSDHLCLPNKLFEYAFAGLPVIASRLPEIERVVRDYELGVCADLDPVSIGEAIEACTTWPRDLPRERLKDLSWESQARDLRSLYDDLRQRETPGRRRTENTVEDARTGE